MKRLLLLAGLIALPTGGLWAQDAGFINVDAGGPIEITADALEVRQEEGVATFQGNVEAVQGELTLTADALDVFYEGEADGSSIQRVVASGDVIVSSPPDSARGDEGVYDVELGRITLTGDVVLTREDNILRGNRLEVDLASGVSTMRGAGQAGRVRALFQPTEAP